MNCSKLIKNTLSSSLYKIILWGTMMYLFTCVKLNGQTIDSTVYLPQKNPSYFLIKNITLEGNKRTRNSIITRELNVKQGDTVLLKDYDSLVTWNSQRVFNTRLFNKVTIGTYPDSGRQRDLQIKMAERWYIFPIPIISFGDRNPNEWLKQRGADIRRLNFGIN
ncbi:MAG: hypothetical protein K2Q22_14375, partial [Cytophagales bacterium]|nr:hypothetical protein [Cytophagales bacterium]